MRKIDAILAGLIGLLNGIFFVFILGQAGKEIPYSFIFPIICACLAALGMWITSLIGKRLLIFLQAAKFFLVGTLNTFLDLGVLNFLIWLSGIAKGGFYSIFKTISFLGATTNSYFWNKYWTFERKREKVQVKEFSKFFLVTLIGLSINVGVASFVVNVVPPQFGLTEKIWATVGAIVAAFFAFSWNFVGAKFIVFK